MKGRDITAGDVPTLASGSPGRKRIAVIGIDRYRSWPLLSNGVSDAKGALQLFERLGFERVGEPLFDDAATGAAIHALVADDLMALGPEDSLLVFFAGHGGTRSHGLGKSGYLIPVDAAHGDKVATWIDLDDWLRKVARLPPRHILVFLDSCFGGIALSSVAKWRDSGTFQDASLASLQARRSRRIITSALDDQIALDSGPIPGHSLFTGCLIEGFTRGRLGEERGVATGTEVGLYLQQRVGSYPHSRQTPDFGAFEHDDRGEMVIPCFAESLEPEVTLVRPEHAVSLPGAAGLGSAGGAGGHDVRASRRVRWIAAAVLTSIMLASSFVYVSCFAVKQPSVAEPRARDGEPRSVDDVAVREAAVAGVDAGAQDVSEREPSRRGSAAADPGGTASRSLRGAPKTVIAPQPEHQAGSRMTGSRSSTADAIADRPPEEPVADGSGEAAAPDALASSTDDAPIAKRRMGALPNRRVKPAVDERDCPVEGTQPVTIDSYPPGALLYLNHVECGARGKTPWNGKLRPSQGTATGRFTAIIVRPGEQPVLKEFEVVKSTRIQRVRVDLPTKP